MKPYAVLMCRIENARSSHLLFNGGRQEAFGYAQQNGGPVPDPRAVNTPIDIWWAETAEDARGVMTGLVEANPGKTFVMVKSAEMMQSVADSYTTSTSKFTDKGLLPS